MEKMNGEIIAGIAFIFISLLFIFAASVNSVWAIILPADYLIMAIGAGLVILGVVTLRKEEDPVHHH
jgi:carbon starvation protein CstA